MRHAQLLRRRLQRRQHHRDLVHLRRPTGLGPVLQPGDPLGGVALLPRDHRRLGHPDPVHDLVRPDTLIGQQHDPRPLRQPRRHRRRPRPPTQLSAVLGGHLHSNSQRHAPLYREVKLFHSRDTRSAEDVGSVETDRSLLHRQSAEMRVLQHSVGGVRIVEQGLHRCRVRQPGGGGRAFRRPIRHAARCPLHQPAGPQPFEQVPNDIACLPARNRGRPVPVAAAEHQPGEAPRPGVGVAQPAVQMTPSVTRSASLS